MKRHIRGVLLATAFALFVYGGMPADVSAQYSGGTSAYRSKIKKLDKESAEHIYNPILLGVTIGQLWPNFGDPRDGGKRKHEGFDIMAPEGAPIVSPTDAVVVQTGTGKSSGRYVSTMNPGGERFVYMHLSETVAKRGQVLKPGDIIGLVGDTGNAKSGPAHLHFEIRKGRKALDPFPRITETFSLKEKIKHLEDVIEAVKDEDEFIEFVAETYKGELWQAQSAGIKLSAALRKELGAVPVASATGTAPGDLDLGAEGPLVTMLQSFLIVKATGDAAEALAAVGATGYFGPTTKRALAEYQLAVGITPASGYYGPTTRAYILAHQ